MSIKKTLCRGLLLATLIFGLTATQSNAQAPKPIQNRTKQLFMTIQHKDWDKAYQQTLSLRKYYDKNSWKYQLMGDEQEYESISNDIENLKAAIIAKDKTQSLIIVSDIKEIFDQIFQL